VSPPLVELAKTAKKKAPKKARPHPRARRRVKKVQVQKARHHRLIAPPAGGSQIPMTEAQVDRLFWRAGFGPTAEDRANWTGKSIYQAVNWLLNVPQGTPILADPNRDGRPLAPTTDDTDLQLSWLNLMVRARNPLVERLTFFWHRHFANSRDDVSPPQLLLTQNGLFRKYADLGANPTASFKDLTYEVGEDPSMLRYLTGEDSTKRAINENYARELMELFSLGVTGPTGQPNYTEDDVKELAKAFTGWQIDDEDPDQVKSYFNASRWFSGNKTVLGKVGNFHHRDAVDVVLAHPSHGQFLVRKLWHEFIVTEPDPATLNSLVATYTGTGFQIKPLVKQILLHPAIFESPGEPNMIKPPVVYVVGALRATGQGITSSLAADSLSELGQRPYFPPTVAGWEGGLSWLNTNTALARFRFANRLVNLKAVVPQDVPGEGGDAAFDRAYAAVNKPWLSDKGRNYLKGLAIRMVGNTAPQRAARQIVLRAMMIGGPDAQVM
jgi:uncharacterized protein (DUF1800 family)